MERNGIHIINLEETLKGLTNAIEYLTGIVNDGGEILFVGTKKNAKDIIQQESDKCGMFYIVERWLGGTLTNFSTIRKSIKRLQLLEKESSPIYEGATKKEMLSLEREMIRLQDLHRGIKDMKRLPNALFVVDAMHESIAISEAKRLEIPVVAIVDTNTDPDSVDYPIPANDDSIRAIKLIVGEISKSICDSRAIAYSTGAELESDPLDESEAKVDGKEINKDSSNKDENLELESNQPNELEENKKTIKKLVEDDSETKLSDKNEESDN
tara:strand:- start:7035 stop:7841 length:807 start_codon:yes stop_codon:yes gene_type:complete